ncbi:hypothetical protein APA_2159 [Pseudanabaena sp. lw0831]|uniref:hypothetical protein n=1 Tax=Pseudanabaena sp. lw0831 TaxID=1357935 RepID=UPI001914FB1E|nr:hypothetical protein [Pseudanabaena sp. lw0831]GBO54211.1 hypothetical protein APA_2159 [Pseudanabaena sp. lw0831]
MRIESNSAQISDADRFGLDSAVFNPFLEIISFLDWAYTASVQFTPINVGSQK